jgi:hypothetical protein
MNGLPYYKRYPRDFLDGTAGWPLDLKGAYSTILDLIYLHGGRLVDEPRFIAGHLGCSVRAWNQYRATLIEKGNLQIIDGLLSNYVADKQLESLGILQEKQREKAMKPRRNNDLDKATAKPKVSHTDTDTDTDIRDRPKGLLSSVDDVQAAFDAYNDLAKDIGLPVAQMLTPKRKTGLRQRLADAGGIQGWHTALEKARASPLCRGDNDRGWKADLDFLLQQKSFTRLMEGSYDNGINGGNGNSKLSRSGQSGTGPTMGDALAWAARRKAAQRTGSAGGGGGFI